MFKRISWDEFGDLKFSKLQRIKVKFKSAGREEYFYVSKFSTIESITSENDLEYRIKGLETLNKHDSITDDIVECIRDNTEDSLIVWNVDKIYVELKQPNKIIQFLQEGG